MINTARMCKILKMSQNEVKRYMKSVLKSNGYKPVLRNGYLYAKGNLPVTLVAHMDTVFGRPNYIYIDGGIMSSQTGLGADDRAGIYAICKLVDMGYRPNVLLLEDEEIGCVGAEKFVEDNVEMKAKYLIELDRSGSKDCVFYDCENDDFTDFIEGYGFKSAWGSYSDISVIAPHYGIAAVNLSVGYYDQHTLRESLILGELNRTINTVAEMMETLPEEEFKYVESVSAYYKRTWAASYTYPNKAKIDEEEYYYGKKYSKNATKSISVAYGLEDDYDDDYERQYYQQRWEESDYYKWKDEYQVKFENDTYEKYNGRTIDALANAEVVNQEVFEFITNEESVLIPITDCYLNLADHTIVDLHFNSNYMIGNNNKIYHCEGALIEGATLLDYDYHQLSFRDFANDGWAEEKDYYDYERVLMN